MIGNIITKYIIFFLIGLMAGGIIESIYRSIEHKKFIKPKFINGAMYGFVGVLLFVLSILNISVFFEILLMIFFTTGIEFMVGYTYLKIKKIHLWSYSHQRFNYKGIICPLFSFYWLLMAVVYYYLALPWIISLI